MYEVFLKSWFQELPNDELKEEVMFKSDDIEDAWIFLKMHAKLYIENYPIVEMGVRLETKKL